MCAADGLKNEFDRKEKENPSSPKDGQINANGTYTVGADYKYQSIKILYRKKGEESWTAVTNKVRTGVKNGKQTWAATLSDLTAAEYEVRVDLLMINARGEDIVAETKPAHKVKVNASAFDP